MRLAYALKEMASHWNDHPWWRKRLFTHVISRYFRGPGRPDSDPILEENWDNLIILDACRYDLFKCVHSNQPLPGSLQMRTSVGSGTPSFLQETFGKGEFHDIVYVSGNPYVNTQLSDRTFHEVEPVWKDGWDEELQTVHPETMAERAIEISEKYPKKRIVCHFLQPHAPFVGDVSLGNRQNLAIREQALGDTDAKLRHRTPFEMLDAGDVGRDEVWNAYLSNLEFAWPSVRKLLHELKGLNAVTSDHGNALGERAWPFPIRVYGHPLGVLIPALTDVPWLTHRNGDRKSVIEEPPKSNTQNVNEDVNERLRSLGYAE